MIDLRDIYSLSDFQRRTREHIRRLERTGRPAVLTVNGRAKLVVQGAGSYQELLTALEGLDAGRAAPVSEEGRAVLEPDPVIDAYKQHVDRTLLRENLRRSVDERLRGLVEMQRLQAEAQAAGREARGSVEAPGDRDGAPS